MPHKQQLKQAVLLLPPPKLLLLSVSLLLPQPGPAGILLLWQKSVYRNCSKRHPVKASLHNL